MNLVRVDAGEGDLLHMIDKFLFRALLRDDELAVLAFGSQALRREGTAVADLLRVLGDCGRILWRPFLGYNTRNL